MLTTWNCCRSPTASWLWSAASVLCWLKNPRRPYNAAPGGYNSPTRPARRIPVGGVLRRYAMSNLQPLRIHAQPESAEQAAQLVAHHTAGAYELIGGAVVGFQVGATLDLWPFAWPGPE